MIFIYCNGNSIIGAGHFWRSFNIAIELKEEGIKSCFLSNSLADNLKDKLEEFGIKHIFIDNIKVDTFISVIRNESTYGLSNEHKPMLIIDSDDSELYSESFQDGIMISGVLLMIITVNPNFNYKANLLLNQNVASLHQNYKTEIYTKKLFGPKFFIFSKEYRGVNYVPLKDDGKNILIAFGSADPINYTTKILNHLIKNHEKVKELQFEVVVGGLNPNYSYIKEMTDFSQNIKVHYNLKSLKKVLLNCDLIICSPGLIFWEATLLGLKSILFSSSNREKGIADFFMKQNYAPLIAHYDDELNEVHYSNLLECITSPEDKNYTGLNKLKLILNSNGIKEVVKEVKKITK